MKNASFSRSAACLGLVLLTALAVAPAWSAERGPLRRAPMVQPVETEARVIVKFKADSSMMRALAASRSERPRQANAMSLRLGFAMRDGHALGAHTQVLKASGLSSRDLAARLSAQSDVEYAEVDERVRAFAAPNDPFYLAAPSPAVGQWYLRTPSAALVSAVNAEAAWAITTGRSSVVVAVLDTGVRFEHPDLAGKLLPGYDFVGGNGTAAAIVTANDGDARDGDPSDPGDGVVAADVGVVDGCTDADIGRSSWHGTQTAGLVGAATNNRVGMAGIGRDVMVLPVRVLGKCGGFASDIQAAMLWSAGIAVPGVPNNPNPAKVINLSLGSPTTTCSQPYQEAVDAVLAAGVVVVAAAGNDGLAVGTPAACRGVIGVAGVRHTGTKVGYSNLGSAVSISAPAGNCFNTAGACLYPLLTTTNDGSQGPGASIYTDGVSEQTASLGTSFSSPLVAGTAALMFSVNSTLSPAQVLAALKGTARTFPASGAGAMVRACTAPTTTAQASECYCTTSTCGAGLLDAGAAVAAVAVVTANIAVASTAVVVGDAVALDGAQSRASGTASITTYLWAITSGSATITSANDAQTATLTTSAVGNVVVSLTVTDSAGRQASTSTTLVVSATPGTPVTPAPTSGGGGGGGALNLEWLLTLVASTLALHLASRRQRRAAKVR
jgi:serine protease